MTTAATRTRMVIRHGHIPPIGDVFLFLVVRFKPHTAALLMEVALTATNMEPALACSCGTAVPGHLTAAFSVGL